MSVFGGAAWTRVCDRSDAPGSPWENDKQWYLHLFDSSQPDLNWEHPEVRKEFRDILRFWLDLGVDGFRVDVAHGMAKDPALPDWQFHYDMVSGAAELSKAIPPPPQWNRPEVHDIYREWHDVLAEYGADRALVAEAWVDDLNDLATYVRSDEMHQAFNFDFLTAPWGVESYRETIRDSLAAMDFVGAPTTWVLSNHDVVRAVSRFGLSKTGKGPNGIRKDDEQPDVELGFNRAIAAHVLQTGLPGSSYIYQGEELGLPEHMELPEALREDPAFFRTNGKEAGRDGCRIPMPWCHNEPGYGFSPTGEVWLPQPETFHTLAADYQRANPDSTLNLFRRLFALRKELQMARAALYDAEENADHLHYISRLSSRADVHIICTFDLPVQLPKNIKVIVQSREFAEADGTLVVPPNAALWYMCEESD
ncbi:alpha-glucosidase [Trueperella bonasi]|uniref:Alpha-glucosidase n=1 Tax=Trueperella bonasi TaxID=312286 RepID=A0ABT9NH84_9ACTO|nr:alpha-amylase family glycosyl hydrolase [Trueperella bonasi]MDP9806766.1 alpha-glucosidase [Trueperella bonasi]